MPKSSSRNYTIPTLKRLYALSGNRCAFPGCSIQLMFSEDEKNLSNICHIEDANPDTHKLDRYNPNMTDMERADYKNLILLCPNHHIETNNPAKYPVETLRKMKREHEKNVMYLQFGKNSISKYPSVLSIIINEIGKQLIDDILENNTTIAPNTVEKIKYNDIVQYKYIIEEYSIYQGKLNSIYEEIERHGSSKKSILLQNIKSIYLKEKGKYKDIEEIRANADLILENIENEIWMILESSSNLNQNIPIESIKIGVLIIMVDAFMRCKIFEEPKKLC